jgi:hypothetical protein
MLKMSLSSTISPLKATLTARKGLYLIILLTFSSIALIAALAIPPCLIATIKVFSKFGALKERFY